MDTGLPKRVLLSDFKIRFDFIILFLKVYVIS
nr:MAG TPA: hypothetical protein [Caudoviricetes sp.]DAL07851.1 MAG TPA: hypothetical protein [Bacteriophage sp.]DAP35372.1 MAG TPA: hypothetical protein [Caudoviricetes sp.]DAP63426.1 MAG TPA: hypothetical protein [Caudoviricetes sp.]DAS65841.1 MAG TPA: hypothetical protein [Caudoviricetes sp.]